jgi:steroid 5-alpha reductase family enzyme
LYYGLAIPVWFTGKLPTPLMGWQRTLLNSLIASQWFGFGVAALGDLTKTHVKAREKDEQFLVTTGIFSWVRHPNYVGEIIGWTGNALMGLVSMTMGLQFSHVTPKLVVNVGLLGLGWVGILFVLLRATTTLESRQAKDYGELEAYQSWIAKSWGGWQLPTNNKPANDQPVLPHLELDEASIEESGSGI